MSADYPVREKQQKELEESWEKYSSPGIIDPATANQNPWGAGRIRNRGSNNNPLNIRKSNERWLGEVRPSTDAAFKQFESMGYGFRAALKLLRNYIGKGFNTIEKIVTRWAPPSENHTTSYINNVANRSGIPATQVINRDERESLIAIAYAMAISENGKAPEREDIEAGWDML